MPTFGEIYARGVDYRLARFNEIKDALMQQESASPAVLAAQWQSVRAEQDRAAELQKQLEGFRKSRLSTSQALEEAYLKGLGGVVSTQTAAQGRENVARIEGGYALTQATLKAGAQPVADADTAKASARGKAVEYASQNPGTSALNVWNNSYSARYAAADTYGKKALAKDFADFSAQNSITGAQQAIQTVLDRDMGGILPTDDDLNAERADLTAQASARAAAASQGQTLVDSGATATKYGLSSPKPYELIGLQSASDLPDYTKQAAYNRLQIEQPDLLASHGIASIQDWDKAVASGDEFAKGEVARMAGSTWQDITVYGDPRFTQLALEASTASRGAATHAEALRSREANAKPYDQIVNEARGMYADLYTHKDTASGAEPGLGRPVERLTPAPRAGVAPVTFATQAHANVPTITPDAAQGARYMGAAVAELDDPAEGGATHTIDGQPVRVAPRRTEFENVPERVAVEAPNPVAAEPVQAVPLRTLSTRSAGTAPPALEQPIYVPMEMTAPTPSLAAPLHMLSTRASGTAPVAVAQPVAAQMPMSGSTMNFNPANLELPPADAVDLSGTLAAGKVPESMTRQSTAPTFPHLSALLSLVNPTTGVPTTTFKALPPARQDALKALAVEVAKDYAMNIDEWRADRGDPEHASEVFHTAAILQTMGVPLGKMETFHGAVDLPTWEEIATDRAEAEQAPAPEQTKGADTKLKAQSIAPSPLAQEASATFKDISAGQRIASESKSKGIDPLQAIKQADGRVVLAKKEIQLLSDLASRANQPTGQDLTKALASITGTSRWLNDRIRSQAKTYYASILSLKKGG